MIDFATLGGDAGYIGAAGMARLEHRKQTRGPQRINEPEVNAQDFDG